MEAKKFNIVGIGEILFDVLPDGKRMLGGASANFAYIATQLGNEGIIASRVGDDSTGFEILRQLNEKNVGTKYVQTDNIHQTGEVKVELKNGQPNYQIIENVAWDHLEFDIELNKLANECDAVCFGSLAQRDQMSRMAIQQFIGATNENCLKIFDVNLRQNYYSSEILSESLGLANILKLNNEELPIIVEMFEFESSDNLNQIKFILDKFNLQLICLTRGDKGSLLISDHKISDHNGIKTQISNAIGAGDAFTATIAHGLLRNWNLDKLNKRANKVGAFVASKEGAMPDFENFNIN